MACWTDSMRGNQVPQFPDFLFQVLQQVFGPINPAARQHFLFHH
jgi:hypothetical protein